MSFDISIPAVAIVFLLLLSAFFSGSETALTAASRARLTELERRGSWRASVALSLTKSRERLESFTASPHFCFSLFQETGSEQTRDLTKAHRQNQ
jgi:hypothetical protein